MHMARICHNVVPPTALLSLEYLSWAWPHPGRERSLMSHAFTLELCNLIGLQIFCSRNKPDIAVVPNPIRSRPGWGHAQLGVPCERNQTPVER